MTTTVLLQEGSGYFTAESGGRPGKRMIRLLCGNVTCIKLILGSIGASCGRSYYVFLSIWSVGEQIACTFPRQWRGRYFQSGLGDVFIRDHAITTKGHCVQHNRDYFLLYSRSVYVIHCFYFAPSRPGIVILAVCVFVRCWLTTVLKSFPAATAVETFRGRQ